MRRSLSFLVPSALLAALLLPAGLGAQTFTESTVYAFAESYPTALLIASDGNFYGVAVDGGTKGTGSVFRVTPAGVYTDIYSFTDAGNPGSLLEGTDGNFYGVLASGGVNSAGAVFKVTPAGQMTLLYSFDSEFGDSPDSLVQGIDGNFYGTTFDGGGQSSGSIFKVTPAGDFTLLYTFTGAADSSLPDGKLVQASDGAFYGTTSAAPTFYQITPQGAFSTVLTFTSTQAQGPDGLIEGTDGNFYGASTYGGTAMGGTLYETSPSGDVNVLYTFTTGSGVNYNPQGSLFLAGDGKLYGTATGGGNGDGTVFRVTEAGSFSTIYTFTDGKDGKNPGSGVVQGPNGSLYGVNPFGGKNNDGVLFELTASPALAPPITLTLSPSTVTPGSSFTLTYTVANAYSDTLQYCFATNTTKQSSAWTGLKTGKPTAQMASLTAPSTAGTYTYALTCGGFESGFATLAVGTSSSTALSVSPNPLGVGQSATLQATVTGMSGTPTGSVTYSVQGTTIGNASLNASGVASLIASTNGLAPGTYPVVATYNGNSTYNVSASTALDVTLNKAATSTALATSATSVTPPASVTLTATVTRSASGATGHPTGSVAFTVGGSTLATVKLNSSGVSVLTASSAGISPGSYPIVAVYSGDASDNTSKSSAVTITVK